VLGRRRWQWHPHVRGNHRWRAGRRDIGPPRRSSGIRCPSPSPRAGRVQIRSRPASSEIDPNLLIPCGNKVCVTSPSLSPSHWNSFPCLSRPQAPPLVLLLNAYGDVDLWRSSTRERQQPATRMERRGTRTSSTSRRRYTHGCLAMPGQSRQAAVAAAMRMQVLHWHDVHALLLVSPNPLYISLYMSSAGHLILHPLKLCLCFSAQICSFVSNFDISSMPSFC
jgi:hypothetical protein